MDVTQLNAQGVVNREPAACWKVWLVGAVCLHLALEVVTVALLVRLSVG